MAGSTLLLTQQLIHKMLDRVADFAPSKIADISDARLDEWIEHIQTALKDGDRGVGWRALRQFVKKIVVKNETGTLYYTLPLEAELYMPSVRNLDLRGFEPLTSTVRL